MVSRRLRNCYPCFEMMRYRNYFVKFSVSVSLLTKIVLYKNIFYLLTIVNIIG